jgi:hypothetical protein
LGCEKLYIINIVLIKVIISEEEKMIQAVGKISIKYLFIALLVAILVGCDGTNLPESEVATQISTQVATNEPSVTLFSGTTTVEETSTATPLPTAIISIQDGIPPRNPAQNTTLSTFTTLDFSGAGICAACHIGLVDQANADVSMPTAWRSTMMGNSGRDPVWQAKVSSEVARFPVLQEVIEQKCTTCHMPMAETQAVIEGAKVSALGEGFYNQTNLLHQAAIDGVSCTLCHQISDVNLGEVESFSGHYKVDSSTSPPNRSIYGPYMLPNAQVMRNNSGFNPEYGEHMATAEQCATCHNLYTPYVDSQGNILGEFPEQTPYTEWQNSTYGVESTSCQSCHMPLAQGSVVISNRPGRLAARTPFYQHFFVGGNIFILNILSDWGGDLEVGADQTHFDTTIARVKEQISQNTATLTLMNLDLKDNILIGTLQVSQLAGHKFPTSFPSRRAWLHVIVTDVTGNVIFESGKPNQDGSIAGNDADMDASLFEPHYDLITNPDQVQIYEPIMGDNEGFVTYTLLRGAAYLKDNRLLPDGANKDQLPTDIAVYGMALGDTNFVGGGDTLTYQIDVIAADGPFTFSAELLYEPLSYRFIQDLLVDQTDLTEKFIGYYGEVEKSPLRVAAITPVQTEE